MEDFRSPPPVGGPRWDLSRPYELPSGRLPRLQQHSSGRDDTAPNRLPQQQQQQDEEEQPHLVPPPLDTQGVPASPSRASSTTPRVMTRSRTPTLPVQLKLKIPPTPEPKRTAATPTTPKRQWIRSPARLPKLNARLGLRSRFRGSNHTPDGSDACSSSSSSSSSSRVRNHHPSGAGPMPLDRHESHKGPQHERDQKPNETDNKHHHHHNDHHSEGGLFRDGMDIVAYQERPVVKSARNKHRFKHKRHLLRPAKRCDHQSPDEATEEIVVGAIETVATKIGRSPVLVSFVGPDQGEGPPPSSSDSPRSIRDRIPTGRFVSEDRAGLCAGTGDGGYGCDCDSYPDSGVVCYPYEDQDQDHCGEEGQGGDQTIDDGVVVFREAAPGPNKRPVIYREGTGRNGKDSNDSNSYNFRAVHNRGDGVFCSIENTLLTICSTINRV